MKITLHNLGRRYNQEWIFRHFSYTFCAGKSYAILGPNGSGKSTLLKVLSGSLTPSTGELEYAVGGTPIVAEEIYQELSMAAPYVELIEEFTLAETIAFHFKFKSLLPGFDSPALLALMGLEASINKELRFFSSGMKQRVKLVLACCSASRIVILDEPTSNLDVAGEAWFLELIALTQRPDRLFLIGSNQPKEYSFCDEQLQITDYKA